MQLLRVRPPVRIPYALAHSSVQPQSPGDESVDRALGVRGHREQSGVPPVDRGLRAQHRQAGSCLQPYRHALQMGSLGTRAKGQAPERPQCLSPLWGVPLVHRELRAQHGQAGSCLQPHRQSSKGHWGKAPEGGKYSGSLWGVPLVHRGGQPSESHGILSLSQGQVPEGALYPGSLWGVPLVCRGGQPSESRRKSHGILSLSWGEAPERRSRSPLGAPGAHGPCALSAGQLRPRGLALCSPSSASGAPVARDRYGLSLPHPARISSEFSPAVLWWFPLADALVVLSLRCCR